MMELKDCPFCAGPPKLIRAIHPVGDSVVKCKHCGARGATAKESQRAKDLWNRRVTTDKTEDRK